MKKNDILTGIVDALGFKGEGIVHVDGTTVFVPFVLPGEKIVFRVLKVKGNIAYGKAEKIEIPSPMRVDPLCPVFGKCGGCDLQHLEYKEHIIVKAKNVENCFSKIAGIDVFVGKKFYSPLQYGYRNKIQLPVREKGGKTKIGFFREGSHDVVEIIDCPLHPDWAKKLISAIKKLLEDSGIAAYNEERRTGLLRHVTAREAGGSFLFAFVLTKDEKSLDNEVIRALSTYFDDFSVLFNINDKANNVILGDVWRTVYGKGYIDLMEFGVSYPLNAASFYQVNTPVKNEIYSDVLTASGIDEGVVAIDAYSGAGVLTAMLAKRAKRAYGIEIVSDAVRAADELAERNGVTNMENVCAPCEDALPALIKKLKDEGENIVVVLDPPRSGVDRKVAEAITRELPDRVVYISCSPQTLARDVGLIVGSLAYSDGRLVNAPSGYFPRYSIESVGVYDMFANTKRVETVVRLSRR